MLQLDNFFAWITMDGRELREYGVEYSPNLLQATCWIASEEQKNFVVHWQDAVRPNDSTGRVSVDGVRCGVSKGINQRGYRKDPSTERDSAQQSGVPTSTNKDRLFVFAKLELTDDDGYLDSAVSDELGDIKLEISYVKKGERERLKVKPFHTESKVHEKSQKLAQHHIRLGGTVTGDRKVTHAIKPIGNTRVFLFKYRPLDILKARGLVPNENNHSSSCEVIDLALSDNIMETKIPRLQKKDNVKESRLSLSGIISPKAEGGVTTVKLERARKKGDPSNPDHGVAKMKQESSKLCKREIKEDPGLDGGDSQELARRKGASSSGTIKTESARNTSMKQEGQIKFEVDGLVPRIKLEQKGEVKREMKAEEKTSMGHLRWMSKKADIEIIDLTED